MKLSPYINKSSISVNVGNNFISNVFFVKKNPRNPSLDLIRVFNNFVNLSIEELTFFLTRAYLEFILLGIFIISFVLIV